MASPLSLPHPHTLFPLNKTPSTFLRSRTTTIPITITATSTLPPLSLTDPTPPTRPTRPIPGDHGLPILGPIKDRLDYFYNQGKEEFFKSRILKHKSTVFRANMPPGPLISPDSRVIALLDSHSFPVLFDSSKVDKSNLFTGTFSPSLSLTGGYRLLSYLDPSHPSHSPLKSLLFFLLSSTRHLILPEFHSSYSSLFDSLESQLASSGKAPFNDPAEQAAFTFLSKAWLRADPARSPIGPDGPKLISKWVLFQLAPILTLGLPKLLEELTLHTFRLPASLVKKDYNKLYDFFYQNSTPFLDEAVKLGISRDEACHNLVFTTCFNSFGGMKIFFPNLIKQVGRAGAGLHARLAAEIRGAVASIGGGKVTMAAIENMPVLKSVVYEALRIEPPVPLQYGRAKKDFIVESHEAAFEVKEGELLFGYQPLATKDPVVFERAEEFVADRFVGEGEGLLKYVVWSNGPETEKPTVDNKQCAGKDFVVLVSRLLLVELFLRYDSFEIDVGSSPLGSQITVTSLKRASF